MPRTTRKSATVGPSLDELWSERELKAVLRTTRTVEKAKEEVKAEAAKVEAAKAEAAKEEAAKDEAAEAAKVEAEKASDALADQEEAAEAAKVEAETASDTLADQEVERLTQVDQPASRLEVAVPRAAHLSTAFGPVAEPLDEPIEQASPALEDSATEVAEGDIGYASSLEDGANGETQHAASAGGGPLLAAVVAAAEEVLRIRDDQRAENDQAKNDQAKNEQAKNEQAENEQAVNERHAENGMSGGGEEVQMVLYCSTMKVGGKRPVMHLYDAKEDPNQLSSLKVKKCAWVDNVPDALKGVMYTPNKALCALRGALDPTKASLGNAGINKNVSLAVNQEGKPILIKGLIQNKTLHTHLCG
jgi:hypothetical protein